MKYIDLGLPSGNLWCDCNVEAETPTEYGNYFTFREVEELIGNKEELMPTKDDFEELLGCCKWEWGSEGYEITGLNGNSIFLPAAGWRNGTSFNYAGKDGYYWSSTPYGSDTQLAFVLYLGSMFHGIYWDFHFFGHSVRRIKKSKQNYERI